VITSYLKRLMKGDHLTSDEMADAMGCIMDGKATPAQMAGFLIAMRLKGETVDEICGAAYAMRARMTPIAARKSPVLDTCGTGGDSAGTFNISTAVAFVAAANGISVAKHGNRAVSSRSGSADVLAALGVNIEATQQIVERCLDEIGLGFLFAPQFHPAMKQAASIRRELGVRTIFNVLGPLTNPAKADRQLLGVFDKSLVRPLAETLGRLGSQHAWVVHGADGMDEITLCAETFVAQWQHGSVEEFVLAPETAGLKRCQPVDLQGGSAAENATLFRSVLGGKGPRAIADAVALNAGAALFICDKASDLREGIEKAKTTLVAGKALEVLDKLITLSNFTNQ
jgi:anthranilate phosphoribosyltransferase